MIWFVVTLCALAISFAVLYRAHARGVQSSEELRRAIAEGREARNAREGERWFDAYKNWLVIRLGNRPEPTP